MTDITVEFAVILLASITSQKSQVLPKMAGEKFKFFLLFYLTLALKSIIWEKKTLLYLYSFIFYLNKVFPCDSKKRGIIVDFVEVCWW